MLTSGTTTQTVSVTRPQQDLTVSPDPGASAPLGSPGGPTGAMSWLSDFNQALQAGMAVTIPISAAQRTSGFDQITVFGVSGQYGAQGQSCLQNLLTAHRFTQGLAFVPQGTATKNSSDSVSGYTRSDPNFTTSFQTERQGPLVPAGPIPVATLASAQCADGWMFAGLLGLDPTVIAHTQYANATDQQDATAMMTASWTSTGEYFLRYLLNLSNAPSATADPLRQFVTQNLRGRGSLPALRVGKTPYGILPLAALASMTSTRLDPLGGEVARYIQTARPIWENTVNAFPLQVMTTAGTTPDQALMNVLARDAASITINAQLDTGPWVGWNLAQWNLSAATLELLLFNPAQAAADEANGKALAAAVIAAQSLTAAQASALGWPTPDADSPLGGLMYLNPLGSNLPHVTLDGQVSESQYLPANYALRDRFLWRRVNVLQYMLALPASQLASFVPAAADLTLLTAVLRQSLLLEYAKAAGQVLNQSLTDAEESGAAGALVSTLGQTTYTAPAGLPAASGKLDDYLQAQVQTLAGQNAFPELYALRSAIQHLSTLSTAALDRVLVESLDVCGYRLDAWAVAVATSLLLYYRTELGTGVSLGVWSYVENLRPNPAQTLSSTDIATLTTALGAPPSSSPFAPSKDTMGFVLGPSLTHAATAAVLRNGYLSHTAGTYTPAFAIDLSSTRVRHALYLLEGMRQGQPLGALLGYLFEQGLQDAGLQSLLQPFRNAYPIVANKMTQYAAAPADAVAASNVVDGAALQGAWEANSIAWGQGGLPASDGSDPRYTTISGLLDQLSDRVDALNDIAVAESVYQVAKGNPTRSGGALNANSREQHPPEPQVVETPRSGLDLTQRVLSCFAVNPSSLPASSWLGIQPATPRASAEPWLEQWLGSILPAPSNVVFQLAYTNSGGTAVTSGPLTLATMGLAALDLLGLAPQPPTADAASSLDGSDLFGSDLERWILFQCLKSGTPPAGATAPNSHLRPHDAVKSAIPHPTPAPHTGALGSGAGSLGTPDHSGRFHRAVRPVPGGRPGSLGHCESPRDSSRGAAGAQHQPRQYREHSQYGDDTRCDRW